MASEPAGSTPPIVGFYQGKTSREFRDAEGRSLDDMLNFDDFSLEMNHDYIQVLFPLPERSPINPRAPLITKATRDAFLGDEALRAGLFRAFQRIAHFYGFDVSSAGPQPPTIVPHADFFHAAQRTWLTRFGHNHLRITRIIRCLRILGLDATAQAFFRALVTKGAGVVSSRSVMYWTRAAERPLHLPPDEDDDAARGVEWLRETA